jgi:hypothetical protein
MSTNDTYLAVLLGNKDSAKMRAWNALSESERNARMQEGIAAWKGWVQKHQAAIVGMGGPLGKTKKISDRGIEDISNMLSAYTVVRADSHEAAATARVHIAARRSGSMAARSARARTRRPPTHRHARRFRRSGRKRVPAGAGKLVGGLMSYGFIYGDQYQQAASYVDKILRGAKPSDLPVQTPTKYETILNRRTAKGLDLTVPAGLLVAADEVIE